ncbi:MAG: hypothetical protein WC346_10170 [Methanogenium sp.]|jgi:DNA ligase-1
MLKRPMKAPTEPITDEELKLIKYPVVGSPKFDGFLCNVDERGGLTSSLKPFTNRFTDRELKNPILRGLAGELIVGSPTACDENGLSQVFHNTSGPLRRFDGEPDFRFYVFDTHINGGYSYKYRWLDLEVPDHPRVIKVEQRLLHCADDVLKYEEEMVLAGYEGAMIRSLSGLYKEGRCTFKEMNIFKRKPFSECEAEIIDIEEQMANLNEAVLDERGLTKRSSSKENKAPKGTLGIFVLRSRLWERSFKAAAGKGFNDERKQEIWNNRQSYLGETVVVQYQKYGSIDRPRMPKVIKIRPSWDIE